MNITDIYRWIDELSDPSFSECCELLYKPLDFDVLALDEIRRKDLKEKVYSFIKNCGFLKGNESGIPGEGFDAAFVKYTEAIRYKYVVPETSRDNRYTAKREDLAETIKNGTDKPSLLEDYFVIAVSQSRCFRNKEDTGNDTGTNYALSKDDIDVIRNIYEKIEYYSYSKQNIFQKIGNTKGVEVRKFSQNKKVFLYLINVLLLFRMLESEGEIE